MQRFGLKSIVVLAAIAVALVLISLVWRGGDEGESTATGSSETEVQLATSRTQPSHLAGHVPDADINRKRNHQTATVSDSVWPEQVSELLQSGKEPAEVGKALLELLPQLPPNGRVEVIQHAANLCADADYAPLGELLASPETSADELEILLADILNRPNEIKLPSLLDIARKAEHPKAVEARQILMVFVGDDFGDDWYKWQEGITALLRETAALENR